MNEEIIIITTTPIGSKIQKEELKQSEYKKWAGESKFYKYIERLENGEKFTNKSKDIIYYDDYYSNPIIVKTESGVIAPINGLIGLEVKPYNPTDDLNDLDAVWGWNNKSTMREVCLWNKKIKCVITDVYLDSFNEFRTMGYVYDNYEKIPRDKEPEWIENARQKIIELRKKEQN